MKSTQKQICTFTVGDLLLGMDVQRVQEVIKYQEMTRVRLAQRCIGGLINLRGQIVTAIDLRTLFELPALPPDQLPMNVIVRDGESAVSLLVDRIGDVISVDSSSFETVPSTLRRTTARFIAGAYKLTGRLLLELRVEETVRAEQHPAGDANHYVAT